MVALVASAGGIDALAQVLAPLPDDLPATVLVVMHQQPDRVSRLASLLDRHTALPVRVAVDGDDLALGVVLVAPPGRHLLVTTPASVGLIDSGALPPARPSADLLLVTLAISCGSRALAVVLTGAGTDGQAGVRAIVHRGGTVFAQDQPTSAYLSMPRAATDTGLVDAVLPLPDIAAAISNHLLHPTPRQLVNPISSGLPVQPMTSQFTDTDHADHRQVNP